MGRFLLQYILNKLRIDVLREEIDLLLFICVSNKKNDFCRSFYLSSCRYFSMILAKISAVDGGV